MSGYLRRKVTYSLGKRGGNRKVTASGVSERNTQIDLNPFYWFTARPPKETNSRHFIVDEAGEFQIDIEYRNIGEREGWLKYIGCSRDANGNLKYRYIVE